jgi:hypothetical protein
MVHQNMNYIINFPVVDLRKEPEADSGSEMQESQLLYGERVEVVREAGDWTYIYATEQQKCLPDGSWSGYPGWVKTEFLSKVEELPKYNLVVISHWASIDSHLTVSFGTQLQGIEELPNHWVVQLIDGKTGKIDKNDVWPIERKPTAESILEYGRKMIGFPYLWGGRCAFKPEWSNPKTSIDCSGFVNLLYRIHGIDLPRDAHDQFLKAKPCTLADLVPGDLLFMGSVQRVNHVMVYTGERNLLEATAASGNVREIRFAERFNGKETVVHFGKVTN